MNPTQQRQSQKEKEYLRTHSQEPSFSFYLQTALFGAVRGVLGLPLEHPFEVIITRVQANSKYNLNLKAYQELQSISAIQVTKDVYKEFGLFSGLYAGFIPNFIRQMSKYFYRFPLMIYIPNKLEKKISNTFLEKYDGSHKFIGGAIIAGIESVIICPFERLKVFLMTKSVDQEHQIQKFFRSCGGFKKSVQNLFTGFESLLYRSMISWVSFMYTDHKIKKAFKEYRGIQQHESLNKLDFFMCSTGIGILNVFFVLPMDKIKTLYQMQGNSKFLNNSYGKNFMYILKREGIKGFYAGLQTKFLQYTIQTGFNSSLLEYLELYLKNKNKKTY